MANENSASANEAAATPVGVVIVAAGETGTPPAAQQEPSVSAGPEPEKKTNVRALFATWDDDGERHEIGDEFMLSLTLAKHLIKEGRVERADPFPGE